MPRQIKIVAATWTDGQSNTRAVELNQSANLDDLIAQVNMFSGLRLTQGKADAELFDKDDNSIATSSGAGGNNPFARIHLAPVADASDGDDGSVSNIVRWKVDVAKYATGKMVFIGRGHMDPSGIQSSDSFPNNNVLTTQLVGGGEFKATINFIVEDVA